jgi:hypothetical protein
MIWTILAAGPKTDDARLVVRWSQTSFFLGCPVPKPIVLDGKEYILYLKCSDEQWAMMMFSKAWSYFEDVKLLKHGELVNVHIDIDKVQSPDDDLLGGYSTLAYKGGSC